jgi:transposase
METRHVRAALSARIAKTDRKDARGRADLLRMGWFRPVHVKTMEAREHRALLTARSTLVRRLKDIENSVRGLLRGFGIKLATTLRAQWDVKVRESIAGHPALPVIWNRCLSPVRRCATRSPSSISGSATQPARTRSAGD